MYIYNLDISTLNLKAIEPNLCMVDHHIESLVYNFEIPTKGLLGNNSNDFLKRKT